MRILLLVSSFNSLTQLILVELEARGYEVSLELAIDDTIIREGIELFHPDLILCPFLTHILPEDVWAQRPCLVLHPGIKGDRGTSSLDWAILDGRTEWGVVVVQAVEHVDAGPIWAHSSFTMENMGSKSSVYRGPMTIAAVDAMLRAVRRFETGLFEPEPLDYSHPDTRGRFRPVMKQSERSIDWKRETVAQILTKIGASDSVPGVLDEVLGEKCFIYGGRREGGLIGRAGEIIGQRHGAICRAAVDGAVWISHLKKAGAKEERHCKLPAASVLGKKLDAIPEIPIDPLYHSPVQTYKEIWYHEDNDVGYLFFEFYNGAMSTEQCERLTHAFVEATRRPTKVIVLLGGRDFWSNGIHLNVIEAAPDAAQESWRNINAIDDLVHTLLTAQDHLMIAAMHGSAGAGGVMLALAADKVFVREGIVLNPHYRTMGGLYGSEYWTHSLPKRVGAERARAMTESCRPVSVTEALRVGLVDQVIYPDAAGFSNFFHQVTRIGEKLARSPRFSEMLTDKRRRRRDEERQKPLAAFRAEELEHMRRNFYDAGSRYHAARSAFVHKTAAAATPPHLARHRGA